jgi:threonine dehydrogenase-like Zn-dependent dehydrogenase
MSTGFAGAESGNVRIGDVVAIFAQRPIGLCATMGARLAGATTIIAVESMPARIEMAERLRADHVVNFREVDAGAEILRLTDDRGVDVAIEALGTLTTFAAYRRVLRPGGTLSSLGVYSGDRRFPLDACAAGIGDHRIITALCPGGEERVRRLLATVASGRADLRAFVTHRFTLDQIEEAHDPFAQQRDGVFEVAITPSPDSLAMRVAR